MTTTNKWLTTVVEDENGELVLVLPEKLIETLQWVENDTLQFIDNNDGTWTIIKDE